MLNEKEILQFINDDKVSEKKRFARKGQAYYNAEHDIRNYRLYYVDADGKMQEDKTRSNIKIAHPFFTELVDQEVQYTLSNPNPFVVATDDKLQEELNEYFGDDFRAELQECLTGTISKGFEHMYGYKGSDNRTKFMTADSMGVVEVRSKDASDDTDHVIYWYVDRMEKGKKEVKRIQVWDSVQTYYYVQIEDGKIKKDTTVEFNPRPHITYKKTGDDALYYEGNGGYGFIPFFRLDNNRKQVSALKPIKDLIDDYDLMACGLSNNLQDISEGLYVVSGFQGHDMDELINNIKVKKHIGVSPDGGVDIKTIDIPYEARKVKLELDEKNIYRFGMGFNSAQLGDGNITNIVIKSRYALLDLKCNKLEINLKQFLRRLIKVALQEINEANGTDYDMKDVSFDFTREVMTNALDNANIEMVDAQKQQVLINTLLSITGAIDDETILQMMCEVLDIDFEKIKDKMKDEVEPVDQVQDTLNKITPDDVGGEGGVVDEQTTT